jgi:hypothetical protein
MERVRWLDSSGIRYGNNKGLGSLGIRFGREMVAFVPKRRNKERLKVPKREIFVTELFILSDPIWVGDLRTEPKKPFV